MKTIKMICAGCETTLLEIDGGNPIKGIALCRYCMSRAIDIAKDREKNGGDFFGGFFEDIKIDENDSPNPLKSR